jgi:DNA-directed RNA polymerase specialized sigma24 family protein
LPGRRAREPWLIGILKHKITDWFRRQQETILDDSSGDEEFFDQDGFWNSEKRPIAWNANPEAVLQSKDFQLILIQCVNQLPEAQARVLSCEN